jgi:IMP dehydrogenase
MRIRTDEGLTFDDVLLEPQYSEVRSRADVDYSITLTKGIKLKFPIIPSNMKTITHFNMAREICRLGGMAILHRFMPIEEQLSIFNALLNSNLEYNPCLHVGFSIGVKDIDKENLKKIIDTGTKIICIDVAHGDSIQCIEMTRYVSETYKDIFLISGNVATYGGVMNLLEAGADSVKIGIGNGSICTTRIETGNGIPLLTSLVDASVAKYKFETENNKKVFIMSDGGCKAAGDLVKALCFADLCMVGNMFAGAEETPGNILQIDGQSYKEYVGSSTHRGSRTEGVAALVHSKGKVEKIIQNMIEGIQSGCSYQGAFNLQQLKEKAVFIKITSSGLRESHVHDVILKK